LPAPARGRRRESGRDHLHPRSHASGARRRSPARGLVEIDKVDFDYSTEGVPMAVEVDVVRAVEVPTRLVHGPGAVGQLGEVVAGLGITRPMLVSDPGVAAAGLVDRVLDVLDNAVVFAEVRPNPDIALVDHGAEIYAAEG